MATVNIETQLTNRINELKKKVLVEAEQKLKFERNAQGTLITTESPRDFKKDVEWLAQKEGMSQKNVDAYKADALKRKSSMFKNIDESILDLKIFLKFTIGVVSLAAVFLAFLLSSKDQLLFFVSRRQQLHPQSIRFWTSLYN